MTRGHLATDRFVWTYLPKGQPAGVITGYTDAGGIVVEHIIRWRGSLRQMLHEGVADAWERGFQHIILMIPESDPRAAALTLLALRMGFLEYTRASESTWFVRYRP